MPTIKEDHARTPLHDMRKAKPVTKKEQANAERDIEDKVLGRQSGKRRRTSSNTRT